MPPRQNRDSQGLDVLESDVCPAAGKNCMPARPLDR